MIREVIEFLSFDKYGLKKLTNVITTTSQSEGIRASLKAEKSLFMVIQEIKDKNTQF